MMQAYMHKVPWAFCQKPCVLHQGDYHSHSREFMRYSIDFILPYFPFPHLFWCSSGLASLLFAFNSLRLAICSQNRQLLNANFIHCATCRILFAFPGKINSLVRALMRPLLAILLPLVLGASRERLVHLQDNLTLISTQLVLETQVFPRGSSLLILVLRTWSLPQHRYSGAYLFWLFAKILDPYVFVLFHTLILWKDLPIHLK